MPVHPATILVVDDEEGVRMVISRTLQGAGFAVLEAEHGEAALVAVQGFNGPLVLAVVDENMPVMTGIEFLRRLRKMSGGEQPKVVFCTTENDLAHIQEALSAGANEYIMKPFDSDIIQTKFAQVGLL